MINEIISIDFIDSNNAIHEIKKSNKFEEASIYQLKFYLYTLKKYKFNVSSAILDYPKLRKRITIELLDEDVIYLEKIINDILNINSILDCEKNNTKACLKCSYYDMCLI